jgi:hypothetical protein
VVDIGSRHAIDQLEQRTIVGAVAARRLEPLGDHCADLGGLGRLSLVIQAVRQAAQLSDVEGQGLTLIE